MLTDLRATRLLCLALLFTSTLSRQAVAQWFIGLEIGSERFWGGSLETTPDQRSFRPYRPTTFSAAVERRSGSLGAALRLRYTDASMALEGSEAVVAVKGVFTIISVSAEISYGIITLGQNQLLLHAGPVVEHWSLVDEDSRFADVERAISDTLRRVLARSRAFRPMATPDQPGSHPTGVELVVTIRVDAQRGDSVRTRIELIDPLAAPSLMHRVVSGKPLPRPEAVREARDLSMVAMTTLTQMSRAPRGGMGVMAETPSAPAPPRP